MYNNEVGTYEAFYYLMTDPRADGNFRILGVRSTGRVGLKRDRHRGRRQNRL